jgi:hypothetical protein
MWRFILGIGHLIRGRETQRTLKKPKLHKGKPDKHKVAQIPGAAARRRRTSPTETTRRWAEQDSQSPPPEQAEGLGLDEAARRALNPGLIDVSLCAWGWSGPWSGRRGFDSLVQMSSGIAEAGMRWKGADRPVPLPVQAIDHATGYLMAAATLRGLALRLRQQTVISARLSLARTAAALAGCGEDAAGQAFAGMSEADYDQKIEQTPWGAARRLRPPVTVGEVTPRWDRPAAELGSAQALWM